MQHVVDGRRLAPPRPLELTLAALEGADEGDEVVLLLHRSPHPLFEILARDGYCWSETVRQDGTHEIRIRRAASA